MMDSINLLRVYCLINYLNSLKTVGAGMSRIQITFSYQPFQLLLEKRASQLAW